MLRLYNSSISGNCYKIRLALAQLERPYESIEVDVTRQDGRPDELVASSPQAKTPLLVLPDGRALAESNAILLWLARGTQLEPEDEFERSRMLQWMFFEQNSHEPNLAVSRYIVSIAHAAESHADVLSFLHARGTRALAAMERQLADEPYFAGGRYSVADIALYAYTHTAEEGGFSLAELGAVRAWMARVEAQPGFVPMIPAE